MNKKKLAKSVVGIALIVSVAILIVVCVGKIKHIQNKKNIIGTWKNANAEEVFTFQENGGLVVNKDMPELGITCGNALYSISSSNMIFVEQRDNSVNFEIEGKRQTMRQSLKSTPPIIGDVASCIRPEDYLTMA